MSRLFTTSLLAKCHPKTTVGNALLATFAFLWGIVPAFAADKTIEVDMHQQLDAVAITRVTLGGVDVQCGLIVSKSELQPVTPIAASGDWLQNIKIHLLNRTDKNIVYGQILLVFPETGTGRSDSPRAACPISFGRRPPAANFSGTGEPMRQRPDVKPVLFAAGKTMVLNLADYSDEINATVDSNAVSKVIIRRSWFVFDDAMRWASGRYSTPDPEHPGKWKYLDVQYFPGWPTWPPGAYKR